MDRTGHHRRNRIGRLRATGDSNDRGQCSGETETHQFLAQLAGTDIEQWLAGSLSEEALAARARYRQTQRRHITETDNRYPPKDARISRRLVGDDAIDAPTRQFLRRFDVIDRPRKDAQPAPVRLMHSPLTNHRVIGMPRLVRRDGGQQQRSRRRRRVEQPTGNIRGQIARSDTTNTA